MKRESQRAAENTQFWGNHSRSKKESCRRIKENRTKDHRVLGKRHLFLSAGLKEFIIHGALDRDLRKALISYGE
jgi:hypothetical protein